MSASDISILGIMDRFPDEEAANDHLWGWIAVAELRSLGAFAD